MPLAYCSACHHYPDDNLCDNGIWCDGAETCDAVQGCVAGTHPCYDGVMCTKDLCNEGTHACTHAPNDNLCNDRNDCNGIETCDAVSGCLPGTPLNCDDGNPCTTDSCDPVTGCTHAAAPAGTVCRAAAGSCDVAETCDGSGADCPADGFASNQTVCRAAVSACDVAETCTGASADCPPDGYASSQTVCRPVAGPCDVAETCTGASKDCPADGFRAGIECRAATPCTMPSVCDGNGAQCPANQNMPDNMPCGGDACTNAGTCMVGMCMGTTPVNCGDGNACTADSCNPATGCGHAAISCDDGDPCTADSCDPASGCLHSAAPDGTACNDADFCTQTDTCRSGTCVGANPVVCPASDQCHVAGTCDPAAGVCSNPAATDGTACDDHDPCTQTDACQSGACLGGNPVVCTASDQCHVAGWCRMDTGQCTNPAAPDGTGCNDGLFCNGGDACLEGACATHAGTPCQTGYRCVEASQSCEKSTNIELVSFTATGGQGQVDLAWETATETDNAGFRLWRADSKGGIYARITADLIPSEGGPTGGSTYAFTDDGVSAGKTYWYKLEDVDIHGQSTFHGPVNATPLRKPLFGCGMAGGTDGSLAGLLVLFGLALVRRAARRR